MNTIKKEKKILILGGAKAQVQLIECAKNLGYYVVLCDWTNDNPGIKLADKHYQVSTLDREAVLEVAKKEKIDGVISNSEPAMANVAYISEKLNLIGNTTKSIEILMSKYKFRNLQEELGLYTPKHFIVYDRNDFLEKINEVKLPIIVKPAESSGSRGTTKIEELDYDKCIQAFEECVNFSQDNACCIEEFVESSINYIIDGDVFVYNNTYFWDGMFFNYRHNKLNMIPTTESWPLNIDKSIMDKVKYSIIKIFNKLDIRFGEYNIEMYLNKNNELFIIEINPRQGGCGIPISIKKHCKIDYSKLLVSLAVKDEEYFNEVKTMKRECVCITKHMVFAYKKGTYKGLYISPIIKKYIKNIQNLYEQEKKINISKNATDVIAYVDLNFKNYETQKKYDSNLEQYIYPIIEEKKNDL